MLNKQMLVRLAINKFYSSKYSIYYSPSKSDYDEIITALENDGETTFSKLIKNLLKIEESARLLSKILRNQAGLLRSEYRQNHMHYKQQTPAACGIACLLMALSIFDKKTKASSENERSLYEKLKEKNSRYVKIESIMKEIIRRGLTMEIFSELDYEKTKFENKFADNLRIEYLDLLDKLKGRNKVIDNVNTKVSAEILKKCLFSGKVVLINGTAFDQPHMRLVSGYINDGSFVVSDPQESRKITLEFKELLKISKPPLGMWAMAISKK